MASKVVPLQPTADAIRQHLEKLLASPEFVRSERMSRFLRFVVTQALAGANEMLKESIIGVHVFERDAAYDPKADPVVRTEARRLRAKLLDYAHNHPDEPLWIDLPKGGYVPEFHWRAPAASEPRVVTLPRPPAQTCSWAQRNAAVIFICSGIAVAALLALWMLVRRTPAYSVLDARPLTAYEGYQASPAFSPDGEKVAFSWGGPGNDSQSIWVQGIHGGPAQPITHSPTVDVRPAWSLDRLSEEDRQDACRNLCCCCNGPGGAEACRGDVDDQGGWTRRMVAGWKVRIDGRAGRAR